MTEWIPQPKSNLRIPLSRYKANEKIILFFMNETITSNLATFNLHFERILIRLQKSQIIYHWSEN